MKTVQQRIDFNKALQYQLRSRMSKDGEYSLKEMKTFYHQIMNLDVFIVEPYNADLFRRKISGWGIVHDGWLIKRGKGRDAVYYKRFTKRSNRSLKEVRRCIKRKLLRITPWGKSL